MTAPSARTTSKLLGIGLVALANVLHAAEKSFSVMAWNTEHYGWRNATHASRPITAFS